MTEKELYKRMSQYEKIEEELKKAYLNERNFVVLSKVTDDMEDIWEMKLSFNIHGHEWRLDIWGKGYIKQIYDIIKQSIDERVSDAKRRLENLE